MEVKNINKSREVRKVILDFPRQFGIGVKAAEKVKIAGKFDKIVICGMGGSASPADILDILLEDYKINIPLYVHRNYDLPYQTDKNSLVICVSYSGNTEETISSFEKANERKIPVLAITSGGKLAELCREYGVSFAKIPEGYQPRMALGFQFAALIKILTNCGLIKDDLRKILALEDDLEPKKMESLGKELAKKLFNKIPIIYTSDKFKNLPRIWKNRFNEGPKILTIINYFPELNHNEMSGFTNLLGKFFVIFIRDPDEHPRILKRMELTAEIIKGRGIKLEIIELTGKNTLFKIFSNIILSDWVSYYLALEYGADLLSLPLQEEFKKKMKKIR